MMNDATGVPLDAETKAAERPEDHKAELRLWLRLLSCEALIENDVRRRLREKFNETLPRFDLMAQLDREPNGKTLGEISKRMMVSNGNITGLVNRLVETGHIDRRASPDDRREKIVTLTAKGRSEFRKMAAVHEGWIADIFAGLSEDDVENLMRLLGKAKASARTAIDKAAAP